MNKKTLLLVGMLIGGCGGLGTVLVTKNCTVQKSGGVATIACPDATTVTVHDGVPGIGTVALIVPAAGTECPHGGHVLMVAQDKNLNGVLDLPQDDPAHSAAICSGQDGQDGADAPPTPFTPVGLVDPCGDGPGYDEVLLRLASGTLLATVSTSSSGANTRLAVVAPGTWATTDGTGCVFTVHLDGSVTW
ncbi:MAG: hypothetical protein IT285_16185 [Bdellovibrionales bacterium]|nr:hypothetical protein [Bdellovibrionales bacterium]